MKPTRFSLSGKRKLFPVQKRALDSPFFPLPSPQSTLSSSGQATGQRGASGSIKSPRESDRLDYTKKYERKRWAEKNHMKKLCWPTPVDDVKNLTRVCNERPSWTSSSSFLDCEVVTGSLNVWQHYWNCYSREFGKPEKINFLDVNFISRRIVLIF